MLIILGNERISGQQKKPGFFDKDEISSEDSDMKTMVQHFGVDYLKKYNR